MGSYDAFSALAKLQLIEDGHLSAWAAIIRLRNRIVRNYVNIAMTLVQNLVKQDAYRFIVDFLLNDVQALSPANQTT